MKLKLMIIFIYIERIKNETIMKMKLLLYCTKSKPYLVEIIDKYLNKKDYLLKNDKEWNKGCLNGKIIGECDYLLNKNYDTIYIENLHVFDEPIILDRVDKRKWIENEDMYDNEVCDSCMDFRIDACKNCPNHYEWLPVSKAPQNMMIVWHNCVKKVLVSIYPEELCEILNGEKTELKRKVLKEMTGILTQEEYDLLKEVLK